MENKQEKLNSLLKEYREIQVRKAKDKKKGFTLVELLVVIAILAILATVSVVGYLGFTKKANISNDISLITQMNTRLKAEEARSGKPATYTDMREILLEDGIDIAKLNTYTQGYQYAWNQEENKLVLLNQDKSIVAPDESVGGVDTTKAYQYWVSTASEADLNAGSGLNFSHYLKEGFAYTGNDKALDVTAGLDVGVANIPTTITYTNSSNAQDVVIRSNSAYTNIRLDAYVNASDNTKGDHVDLYGKYGDVTGTTTSTDSNGNTIYDGFNVAFNSLGVKGTLCGGLTCESGHLDFNEAIPLVKDDGTTEEFHVHATSDNVTVTNDNNYEIHAHADSETKANTLNSKTESTNVAWDYNNNTNQEGTAVWNDVWHHTGESSSDPKSTVKDYNFNNDVSEALVEAKTEETSKSEDAKALYGFMNINTGKGYGFGETEFASAISEASANDKIIVLSDFSLTTKVEVNKNLILDVNGKTITISQNGDCRLKLYDSTLTINGNGGKYLIDSSLNNCYGIFDLRNSSGTATGNEKIIINNLNMEGVCKYGALISLRNYCQQVELYNCNAKMSKPINAVKGGYGDNSAIVFGGPNAYGSSLTVVGGKYEFDSADDSRNVFNIRLGDVLLKNVEIATSTLPIEGAANVTFENCKVYEPSGSTWKSTAVSCSNGCDVVVNGGNYKADWCIETMSSAGNITINGGTFTGNAYLVYAYGDDWKENSATNVTLNDGIFSGAIVAHGFGKNEGASYVYINGGTFTNCSFTEKNEYSHIVITGGTFDCDPSAYVSLPYKAVQDETTGLWKIVDAECYKVTYKEVGFEKFNSQAEAAEFANEHLSDIYIDANKNNIYTDSTCQTKYESGTYLPASDNETPYYINGSIASTLYSRFNELVTSSGWGDYGATEGYYVKKVSDTTYTCYFATEAEANEFANAHAGAVVTQVNG